MAVDTQFGWTLLNEGESGAEVAVNELIARIAAGSVAVLSQSLTADPGSPDNFDAYLVPSGGSGNWSGKDGQIAFYLNGWQYIVPAEGASVWVAADDLTIDYDGSTWSAVNGQLTLTDASGSFAWDGSRGTHAVVSLDGNHQFNAISNTRKGRMYSITITQNGGGGNTPTWNSAFKFAGGSPPALATGGSEVTTYLFVRSANDMVHLATQIDVS